MGIAAFSRSPLAALLAPLQAMAAWFSPSQQPASSGAHVGLAVPAFRRVLAGRFQSTVPGIIAPSRQGLLAGQKTCHAVSKTVSPRRLKIVREFDASASPSCAGRMVISGRMADVCAELDRMAQKEAAFQAN